MFSVQYFGQQILFPTARPSVIPTLQAGKIARSAAESSFAAFKPIAAMKSMQSEIRKTCRPSLARRLFQGSLECCPFFFHRVGQLDTTDSEKRNSRSMCAGFAAHGRSGLSNRECSELHWIQPGPWLRPAKSYSPYRTRQTS